MIRFKMKNCCMILTGKHQKLSSSDFINMYILQAKKYYLLSKPKTDLAKFTYSPLGKALEKQTNKQTAGLKFLNLSDKTNE